MGLGWSQSLWCGQRHTQNQYSSYAPSIHCYYYLVSMMTHLQVTYSFTRTDHLEWSCYNKVWNICCRGHPSPLQDLADAVFHCGISYGGMSRCTVPFLLPLWANHECVLIQTTSNKHIYSARFLVGWSSSKTSINNYLINVAVFSCEIKSLSYV